MVYNGCYVEWVQEKILRSIYILGIGRVRGVYNGD